MDWAALIAQLTSQGSGGWKSKLKVSAGLVSGEAFLLGLQMAASCCILTQPFLCACTSLVSLFYKDTVTLG